MPLTLSQVQAHAAALNLRVDEDHLPAIEDLLGEELQRGYWLVDLDTEDGPFEDENFSTSLEEVAGKLVAIEVTRSKQGVQS